MSGQVAGTAAADDAISGPRADAQAPLSLPGKTIVLFSDGTGNSSAKLFKTNVFRLYEALDLGPDHRGRRAQIAYYDNGVGTSANKFLAVLGGVFGWGLKRNLVDLYLFLCRNYSEGDRIYAFGFSRGAFTIRLLVALICSEGVVGYRDERELARNARDAYRRFASLNNPDMFPWLAILIRWVRDAVIAACRRLRGHEWNAAPAHRPGVEFVGVWDTVAAYGGPIAEITRAIDKWVWPLTMTDYRLHARVKTARHALALDDERDSFQPLLWDEVHEERQGTSARLRQLWFAGMHSDVGGGYPDDSLAYVSLNWMIGEVGTGLRLLPDKALAIRGFANAFGPIHDSRMGMSGYYRYQPRKISACLHPAAGDLQPMAETLILRDPTIGEKQYRPQGLLLGCRVHDSVVARIGAGTDNYAPIVLPERFEVVADAGRDPVPADAERTAGALGNLLDPAVARDRAVRQEAVWDYVWYRRIIYFATVVATLLLVTFPLWIGGVEAAPPAQDSRFVLGILLRWTGLLVPGFAVPWFDAFSIRPVWLVVLVVPILLLAALGRRFEQTLRDRTRRLWWTAMAGQVAALPERTWVRALRNGIVYQASLQFLKWRAAPTLIGVAILFAIPYLTLIGWKQIRLAAEERGTAFCDGRPATGDARLFTADDPCFDTGIAVRSGHRYRVVLNLAPVEPGGAREWRDGTLAVPARGIRSTAFPGVVTRLKMALATPFRRVVPARWLEPIVEVRPSAGVASFGKDVDIDRLAEQAPRRAGRYIGDFTARRDGRLFLFLNDAALPFGDLRWFYGPAPRPGTNCGTATVTVRELPAIDAVAAIVAEEPADPE
jgi:uncharacterized protein (DUF2235 family)